MMKNRKINIKSVIIPPYATTLMESTRAIGYSIEATIADTIDNSVAANAEKAGRDRLFRDWLVL